MKKDKFCIAGKSCPWFKSYMELMEAHLALQKAFDKSWKIWIDHGELAEKTWQDWDRVKDQIKKDADN